MPITGTELNSWGKMKRSECLISKDMQAKKMARPRRQSQFLSMLAGYLFALVFLTGFVTNPSTLFAQATSGGLLPSQLPSGGQVRSGEATIQQGQGPAGVSTMVIQQSTPRAILHWDSFNVGRDATVRFEQPSSSSVALNRVLTIDPSQILGRIQANGQVILANPNGVLFGPSSRVDVGGLVVTVHDITNDDFLNDRWTFGKASGSSSGSGGAGASGASGTGGITNQGELIAGLGGYIALLAPQVVNDGVILAQEGSVALASGAAITLTFGAQGLVSVLVDEPVVNALIENRHLVRAPGGLVVMTAQSANAIFESVIHQSGQVQVPSVREVNGRIVLQAGEKGTATVSGQLNTSSSTGRAGDIQITGNRVVLESTALLEAKGAKQGGEILVGGSWQGSDPNVQQAQTTVIQKGAQLNASGVGTGSGGTVVAWSNLQDGQTHAAGDFKARGGEQGGDGGRIETSGGYLDTQAATGSAAAPKGEAGFWLFDPFNISISRTNPNNPAAVNDLISWSPTATGSIVNADSVESLLDAGTGVVITTGSTGAEDGDITVEVDGGISSTNNLANLTLTAERNIAIGDEIALPNGTLRLEAGGAITQSAAIDAYNLGIYAAGATVTLTNASNRVGNVAAEVGSISLVANEGIFEGSVYGGGLYVGQVGTLTGITATGTVDISSAENLFVSQNIVTTNATNSAVILEAGRTKSQNAYLGADAADVIFENSATVSTGAGGRTTYFTGTYENAGAGLVSLLGTGNEVYRYNSTRSASGYTTDLGGDSAYAIFRQQPSLSLVVDDSEQVYGPSLGDSLGLSFTVSGLLHGDTQASVLGGTESYSDTAGPGYSSSGRYAVGEHTMALDAGVQGVASLYDQFGYSLSTTTGAFTVTPASVSLTAGAAYTREYDGSSNVSVSGTVSGGLSNDTVYLNTTGTTVDANAAANKAVTVSLAGADAANYQLTSPGLTVTIDPKELTFSVASTVDPKTYDGITDATINVGTIDPTVFVGTESVTATAVGTFNSKDVASATSVTAIYTLVDNPVAGQGLAANYELAPTSHVATITAKAVTLSATKVYDGTMDLDAGEVVIGTGVSVGGVTETLAFTGASSNDAHVATAGKYISAITLQNATDGSGGIESNYALPVLNNANAAVTITAAPLTATLNNTGVTKAYDGTRAAPAGFSPTWAFSGLVPGDSTATLASTGSSYNAEDVADATTLTVSGVSLSAVSGTNGSASSDYNLATTSADVAATITRKEVGLSASKVYDGTAALDASEVTVTTGVGSETLTVTNAQANDVNVVTANKHIVAVTLVDATDSSGGLAANYQLPGGLGEAGLSSGNAAVVITAKEVELEATKVYDGTVTLEGSEVTIDTGVTVGGVKENLTYTGATVSNKNVVTVGKYISAITLQDAADGTGGLESNYALPVLNNTNAAVTITAKEVALSAAKEYDGTTLLDTAEVTVDTGVTVAGVTETLTYTGAESSDAHVATANKKIAAITLADGANGGVATNYQLPGGTGLNGLTSGNAPVVITAKSLTATLSNTGVTKVYDGTTAAPTGFTPSWNFSTDLVAGDTTAELAYTSAIYNDKDVADATTLTVSGLTLTGVTGSNNSQPTDYNLLTSSDAVAATVTAKTLALSAEKVYDGTITLAAGEVEIDTGVTVNSVKETLGYSDASANSAFVTTENNFISSITLNDSTDGSGGLVSNYALPGGSNYGDFSGLSSSNAEVKVNPIVLQISGVDISRTFDQGHDRAEVDPSKFEVLNVLDVDEANVAVSVSGRFLENEQGKDRLASLTLGLSGGRSGNYEISSPIPVRGDLFPNPKEQGLVPVVPFASVSRGISPQDPIVPLLVEGEPQLGADYLAMGASTQPVPQPLPITPASMRELVIQEVTPEQLKALSPQDFELLGPEQIAAFSAEQIRLLQADQLLVILPQLTPGQRNAVTNQQLRALQVALGIE